MIIKRPIVVVLIPLLFFLTLLFTLSDYGISWDEPIHFHRGQAYLYFFLTGKTRFDKNLEGSYYQNNQLPAEYFLAKDDGHPPLNGILASVFNLIFFQKLAILGDIQSYHLFNISVSTLLVLVVVLFARETYGTFAGIVSGLVLASYPLFFAESHFNIKDPPQTAFYALTIWAFWKSLKGDWRWLMVSVVSAGFALGMKFNILFLPLIIVPFIIFRFGKYSTSWRLPRPYLYCLLLSPFIIFGIFFGSWPFLWQDPIVSLPASLRWYQDIGTGQATYGIFLSNGLNLFAPLWILFSTPPYFLFLTFIGIITAIVRRKENSSAPLLWLLWLFIPIARVVVPNTTIYGGVRQIMEFIPAMALLAGLGATILVNWASGRLRSSVKHLPHIIILALFVPHFFIMLKLHPNENVYFNSLIGSLPGAKFRDIPYWGNSFGNAYKQAVDWLNLNAPTSSKIALIQGTTLNIPRLQLRDDIGFSNSYWSGIYRDGEYLIELTHNDKKNYPYAWEYVETFLEPVYEVKVDGVAIAKVWKNDLDNVKKDFRKKEVFFNEQVSKSIKDSVVFLDFGKEVLLTRLVVLYDRANCHKPEARVFTAKSDSIWYEEPESIPANQVVVREREQKSQEVFFFPGRRVQLIKLEVSNTESCLLTQNTSFALYILEN